MMLKTIIQSAGNALELAGLDSIIDRVIQEYDVTAERIKGKMGMVVNVTNVNTLEEQLINQMLIRYDDEAGKLTGKFVEPDWKNESIDSNLEARKRVLYRKLLERKGSLLKTLMKTLETLQIQVDTILATINALTENFFESINAKLPLRDEELQSRIQKHSDNILALVNTKYTGGVDALNSDKKKVYGNEFWFQWLLQYQATTKAISANNAKLLNDLMATKRKETVNSIRKEIQAASERIRNEAIKKLSANQGLLTDKELSILIDQIKFDLDAMEGRLSTDTLSDKKAKLLADVAVLLS